ncbi:MAG: YSIRK-type signal peptide-containing protein [Symploca sp. SIO1B1]|nr:YSIRK-type signal peptide-containing protein [Symploca sp. SIO2D2]NER23039.1 YSIRK-type signal peptide-containing protein [Symploca sp. SIO1C2]NER50301.1 YSIRK-type signal peptide-containing protein [Symploca sp. SIO1A3]NER99129.1 YSIRK-type signal peptide-containing protein [Symploca sp. SIO1B1]
MVANNQNSCRYSLRKSSIGTTI